MNDPDDDFRLVALAQQGDMRAYDALVTRHRGRIFAMIRNMIHQEADAWDLSQEVFIKAWNALPQLRGQGAVLHLALPDRPQHGLRLDAETEDRKRRRAQRRDFRAGAD